MKRGRSGLGGPWSRYKNAFALPVGAAHRLRVYDMVHLDTEVLGPLAAVMPSHVRVVWSVNDAYSRSKRFPSPDTSRTQRKFDTVLANAFLHYERRVSRLVDSVDVVAEDEASYLDRHGVRNVRVLPLPRSAPPKRVPALKGRRAVGLLGSFRGRMGEASMHFVRSTWPEISDVHRGFELDIAGQIDDEYSTQLASPEMARLGVRPMGYVPDLATFLSGCRVVVCPFDAPLGMSNRALDALQHGVPVVGGRTLASLPAAPVAPSPFVVAASSAEWVTAVGALLGNDREWEERHLAAFRYMAQWPEPLQAATAYLRGLSGDA